MPAIESLRTSVGALSRNPVVFLAGLLYAVVVLPQRALQLAQIPFAPTALQVVTFFVTPFVVAGLLGMAADALDGEAALDTLSAVGRDRYVPLLIGTFVRFVIQIAFTVAFVVAALVVVFGTGLGAGAVQGGVGGVGTGALAVAVAVFGVLVLAYVLVFFFVQFFAVAIVVDEADPIEGFKRSVGLVRSNLLSTLGYSVVVLVAGVLSNLPVTGFVLYRLASAGALSGGGPGAGAGAGAGGFAPGATATALSLSTPEVLALSLVSVLATALFLTFQQTYAAAFYRRHTQSVEERVLDGGL
ncbi:MAG: hypothetical protein ABEJ82_03440 [Haloplanus sp.]